MPDIVMVGAAPLSVEDVARVARESAEVRVSGGARYTDRQWPRAF
jgi:hypothetical protein